MNRENVFFLPDTATSKTFDRDEKLQNLPLPKLEDTLQRYERSLLPLASPEELKTARESIQKFKNGIGQKLHKLLEEKAAKERNWVEKYWEDIAYHSLRFPLLPYCNMAMPYLVDHAGINNSRENRLKTVALCSYYSALFWQTIRDEKLRPPTNPDGSIIFSSDLYKRLYNTCRIPGVEKDEIHNYFKTKAEGECPTTGLIIGKGRVFIFDFVVDGKILTPQEFLHVFTIARDIIENDFEAPGVPIFTYDERTRWANNRKHLMEISLENAEKLKLIESAGLTLSFDDNEPWDHSELSLFTLDGDLHSRWNDKSSQLISFRNGQVGLIGEHSAYDGTISIAFATFLMMSFVEDEQPDWSLQPKNRVIPQEIKFELDDHLRSEILRLETSLTAGKYPVTVQCQQFKDFGKSFMKSQKIHPDSFIQTALQWAYYKMHGKLAPTYETGTMRVFYHGRTETVRSCSMEVKDWIDKMIDGSSTNAEKAKLFKIAAGSQTQLMNEARKGNGIDRHLFGLWCIAQENNIPIPEFYDDPMYAKSGGGGNFVLSTSTLGYSINVGFVAPMVVDGYGAFYSMLDDCVWIIITAYRDSEVTSSSKFYAAFESAMVEIKEILENSGGAKL